MSASLLEIIKRRIEIQGPMDLGEYMALCLSHPVHGYYMTRDPLGAGGDFTTAPEVSQLFGEMIGVWAADMWMKMGRPPEFTLLECGPGRGTLMADVLRATKHVSSFHDAAKVHLMEISPVLIESQKQNLAGYDTRWISDLTQLNPTSPVLILANEFLDALPMRQLERREGVWSERLVSLLPDGSLTMVLGPVGETLLPHVKSLEEDGIFEVSPALNQYIKSVDILLKKQKGGALFIDYGHSKTGMGDTLQAVRSHRFESIFETPGSVDLTAHVDFENIKNIADGDGVRVFGPVSQDAFLKSLGIEIRAQKLIESIKLDSSNVCGIHEPQIESILSGLRRLIDTEQMGILFKVLALCDDPQIIPAGFDESL